MLSEFRDKSKKNDENRCVIVVFCVIRSMAEFVSVNLNRKYRIKTPHFILIFNDKEDFYYYSQKHLFLFFIKILF